MSLPPVRRLVGDPVHGLPTDPLEVVLALAPLAGRRRLSALHGRWGPSSLLVLADPVEVVEHAGPVEDFAPLADVLDRAQVPLTRDLRAPAGAVGGGWVTLLGHAVGRSTGRVRTSPAPGRGPRLPDAVCAFHDSLLRFDGEHWWAEALDPGDGSAVARAQALAEQAVAACAGPVRRHAPGEVGDVVVPDARAHMAAVEQVVTAVRAGDIAQANVCARFALRLVDGAAGAVRAWVALVEALGPDRAALVTGPWGALVGASPELYLSLSGDEVRSAPIKGTRPADDGAALLTSAKDTSENVMIVDLVRNDLSRVCEPGSVTVDDLLAVQPHSGVAHLVSRVSGRLLPRTGPGAVVAATFPPGSVTGTPKQRATEVTDAVEPSARGAHTGAVGLLGPRLQDLAVTIRSLEVDAAGAAALGVGGGIVADSTPAEEWHEVLTKAGPLLAALGAPVPRPDPSTASAKGVSDPAAGLLETVLAVDGRAVEVADHAARLRRSGWELTGRAVAADVEDRLVAAAAAAGPGAWRLRVRLPLHPPGEPVVEVGAWRRPVPLDAAAGLVLGVVGAPPDGLERHKYADRRWVDDALDRAPGQPAVDDVALADAGGALLETTRACLLALLPGPTGAPGPVLLTPPCDGRVLPGVTRQVLLDLARRQGWPVRLGALDDEALDRAEGLLCANALRGVQWVRSVGGRTWAAPSPAAGVLSRLLLERWQLV